MASSALVPVVGQKLQTKPLLLAKLPLNCLPAKLQLKVGRYVLSLEYRSLLCIYFPGFAASSFVFAFFLSPERKERKKRTMVNSVS